MECQHIFTSMGTIVDRGALHLKTWRTFIRPILLSALKVACYTVCLTARKENRKKIHTLKECFNNSLTAFDVTRFVSGNCKCDR